MAPFQYVYDQSKPRLAGVCCAVENPKCHLPTMYVRYPALFISCANVTSVSGNSAPSPAAHRPNRMG